MHSRRKGIGEREQCAWMGGHLNLGPLIKNHVGGEAMLEYVHSHERDVCTDYLWDIRVRAKPEGDMRLGFVGMLN